MPKGFFTPGAFLGVLALVVGAQIARGEIHSHGPLDFAAFVVFCGVMLLLLRERRDAIADTAAHESAGEGFARLLGRKLNRIRRRLKG